MARVLRGACLAAAAAVFALPTGAGAQAAADRQPAIVWERRATALPGSVWSVESIDLTGDGKNELVAVGETKVWALSAPDFKPVEIADVKDGKMIYAVALDLDADGDRDLAVGRFQVPWIAHRQARVAGKPSKEPAGPDFSVAWIENTGKVGGGLLPLHVIDRELAGVHGMATGDIDGDGTADLIADSVLGPHFESSLAWFRAPSAAEKKASEKAGGQSGRKPGPGLTRHVITRGGATGRPHYLSVADVNNDGRNDVLLGASSGGTFTWWEQPAANAGSKIGTDAAPHNEAPANDAAAEWKRHLVAENPGASNIHLADVNGDGRADFVASCGHGKGVWWYAAGDHARHAIDPDLPDAHALAVGDFDGDGDTDAAASSFSAKVVRWYENDGRGTFTPRDIDTGNDQESYDLKAVDLDQDGRPDLLLAGRRTNNVVWYRNTAPKPETPEGRP